MRHPTPEEIHEYHRRLDEVIEAQRTGQPYDKLAAALTVYMMAHGFGEELPPSEFPELSEPDGGGE